MKVKMYRTTYDSNRYPLIVGFNSFYSFKSDGKLS